MSSTETFHTTRHRTLKTYDWALKASVSCSESIANLRPIVRIVLHFEEGDIEVAEFTEEQSLLMHITKSSLIFAGAGLLSCGTAELLLDSETFHMVALHLIHQYVDGKDYHHLVVKSASWGLFPRFGLSRREYPELECDFFGHHLKNPIGLAAGLDRNGEAIRSLAKLSGFGFIEIGTVTPIPERSSTTQPQMFLLLEDKYNDGVGRVQQRVKDARVNWQDDFAIFGVNIGQNKENEDPKLDFEIGVNYFAPYCDYIVLNVYPSDPTKPTMKNHELQKLLLYIKHLIDVMNLAPRPKVFLKIAPDTTHKERKDIAKVLPVFEWRTFVISTSLETLKSENKTEIGGLSGAPLREISTKCIHDMYKLTAGQVPIIGCGGISSGAHVYEKIRAGASVVQLHSAIVFHGFPIVGKIKRELVELLRKDGFTNISQAVGASHKMQIK